MSHCKDCPIPGLKDMIDSSSGKKRQQLLGRTAGTVGMNCELGSDGCPALYIDVLNDLAEESGKGKVYTVEGVRDWEERLSRFDEEY